MLNPLAVNLNPSMFVLNPLARKIKKYKRRKARCSFGGINVLFTSYSLGQAEAVSARQSRYSMLKRVSAVLWSSENPRPL